MAKRPRFDYDNLKVTYSIKGQERVYDSDNMKDVRDLKKKLKGTITIYK